MKMLTYVLTSCAILAFAATSALAADLGPYPNGGYAQARPLPQRPCCAPPPCCPQPYYRDAYFYGPNFYYGPSFRRPIFAPYPYWRGPRFAYYGARPYWGGGGRWVGRGRHW
jgi:hypothetical protein